MSRSRSVANNTAARAPWRSADSGDRAPISVRVALAVIAGISIAVWITVLEVSRYFLN